MKRRILLGFCIFCCWTLIFLLQKPVFLLVYQHSLSQSLAVISHGLTLDFSMAGYLSVVPMLMLAFRGWLSERCARIILRVYYFIASLSVTMSFVTNIVLYKYWRYPLDATPLFYFLSSPSDALASAPWWLSLLALSAVVLLALVICGVFRLLYRLVPIEPNRHWKECLTMLVLTAVLFLPIRGGVTVSSTNTGKAYFSENQLLNHAAVNPLFSFFESATHQKDFANQYRFMDDKTAQRLVAELNSAAKEKSVKEENTSSDSSKSLLREGVDRPDIYLIILESFSDTLLHQPGVTPNLNRLCRQGVYFSNFYANSFRTDRGLLSILHGFPSPASVSLMKFPKKTANMSSLPAQLKKAGYRNYYYYGGDADFTNMRSFLINQGFTHITEDVDFPVTDRLSKWGVPDHLLFRKVEQDLGNQVIEQEDGSVITVAKGAGKVHPIFRVIQTSSSHEPFDVPYHHLSDERLNAFAYTDSCVGSFVRRIESNPSRWARSLIVIVPDHLGAWPDHIDDFSMWRYHIPFIWIGGALKAPRVISTVGSQQDIAATILGQLQLPYDNLPFSKNLLDPNQSHYAFFMMHDGEGIVTDSNAVIYDNRLKRVVFRKGKDTDNLAEKAKAYVQRLFDAIATL